MTKSARWAWLVSLIAITGAGGVLVFLLSIATNNRALYERHYVWLFWLNVAVALLLGAVIVFAAARLVMRRRKGKFGSRLLLKLAGIFALVGVVPGLLIYTVSYQFVSRSIESWFDVRVEGALDAGLNLGRAASNARVRALAIIPSSELSLSASDDRFLMVTQAVPPELVRNALAVQTAYREYQQRALAREGLRRMYIGTLTLALILAVFGAVLLAVTLGNQLARPLLLLADGMRQVAKGDLQPKTVLASRDEL